jgi:hypothetical protein
VKRIYLEVHNAHFASPADRRAVFDVLDGQRFRHEILGQRGDEEHVMFSRE